MIILNQFVCGKRECSFFLPVLESVLAYLGLHSEVLSQELFLCPTLTATVAVPLSCFRVDGKRWSLLRVEGAARV